MIFGIRKLLKYEVLDKFAASDGIKYTLPDGKLHTPGEKFIISDGEHQWWKYNNLHRDGDLPAIICVEAGKIWHKVWYKNGLRHRDNDLPALIFTSGNVFWFKYGKYHRDNGSPAIIFNSGNLEWWENGIKYKEGQYRQ
jgi:hypothetical protein